MNKHLESLVAGSGAELSSSSHATGVWVTVCRVDEIPMLGARRVRRPQGPDVAVFRTVDNQVYALLDRCPHKAGPLSQGLVFGQQVACPLHNWTIDLSTGCAAAPDVGSTPAFALRVVASEVQLDQGEIDQLGVDLPMPVAGPCRRGDGVALWHARAIDAQPSTYADPA